MSRIGDMSNDISSLRQQIERYQQCIANLQKKRETIQREADAIGNVRSNTQSYDTMHDGQWQGVSNNQINQLRLDMANGITSHLMTVTVLLQNIQVAINNFQARINECNARIASLESEINSMRKAYGLH